MMPPFPEVLSRWHMTERARGVPEQHRSFALDGAPGGRRVLLLHGAGGSPADFLELADDLLAADVAVLCPLLPAHGRGDAALGELVFEELVATAREAHDAWASPGEPLTLIGQSMGAALGIRLAVERDVRGFVALAPALRPYVMRRLWRLVPLVFARPSATFTQVRWQSEVRRGVRDAARRAHGVRCPLLILHSDDDDSVALRGARELLASASSLDKRLEVLSGQGHVLSLAPDRHREVFPRIRAFLDATTEATRSRRSGPRP